MDEGGRLQRMFGSLASQEAGGESAQLVVDEGYEAIGGGFVTGADGLENPRDLGSGWLAHDCWPSYTAGDADSQ